jgi:predicted  nucleic acid-binding Zn-ribbon protein
MSNVSQELLRELLQNLRQRIDKFDQTSRDVRIETTSLRRIVPAHQQDIGDIYEAIHRIEDRLDQIEKRLELRDFQEMAQSPYNPST